MERFFLSLKMERVWRKDYANQEEARRDVTDYLLTFYKQILLSLVFEATKACRLPPLSEAVPRHAEQRYWPGSTWQNQHFAQLASAPAHLWFLQNRHL